MSTETHTHGHTHPPLDEQERRRLGRRAQLLAGASVVYNAVEAVVAITAGLVAGLRLMAIAFFALAGYVGFESARALVDGRHAEFSPLGMGIAVASILIMPALSWAQRRTGRRLASAAVVADSTQTALCAYLSVVLLLGLVLDATLGWWWADPVAGLVIAAVAIREGLEAWRGENCGCGATACATD